ncbi:MAG: hypothetical protein WC313_06190 [Candidatus Kapaibacterium sp.]|jgi:hypothetical protein|nr:hypothetical protein [Candidatus Kapabacteria bacterium]
MTCRFIILIILFVIPIDGFSSNSGYFKYYLYVDFNQCSDCEITFIKEFVSEVKNEGLSKNFAILVKTKKLKEFERFSQKYQFNNIINDTLGQYVKFVSKKAANAFLVFNNENRLVLLKEDIKNNHVDFEEVKNKFRAVDISMYETINIVDSSIALYRPSVPILSNKKDKFVVLDRLDEIVKEYNITTGKLLRQIEVDSSIMYFFIKDSLYYYQSILPRNLSLKTKFKSVNYDKDNNILIMADAFKGLSGITRPKRIERPNITFKFDNNDKRHIEQFGRSIWLEEFFVTKNNYIGLLSSFNKFDVLNDGGHYLASIIDLKDFHIRKNLVNFQEIFNYYQKNDFLLSTGLLSVLDENTYVYLNPWNGLFFKFRENIQDSLQISGYLDLVRLSLDSKMTVRESINNLKYLIINLTSHSNDIIVYMNAYNEDKQIAFSILQIYDVFGKLNREIVLNSSNHQYFRSYLLKVENDSIYLFNQDESENWQILKIPYNELF